ncbi:MAG: 30S ribosomal protein S6 [Candidatus Omnitrophica bacterium CG11_big_fil_rev_8_21_14_0_20_63_9]|nr:MAG: 30S ribosomal protein S6 [Candidatus Omnitrophica bacterium CG11_big_fil_rev_8_21_14_0_20_63_9]
MTTMTTRDYEALVIFKTVGGEQDLARHASQLEEHIKRVGGRIESSQNLGRRRLAFRISRQSEGYYQVLRFHAPTEQIGELERLFRLNDTIVRFMILNAEELPVAAAQAQPQPAAAARS